MSRLVLIAFAASLAFAGCSCDDDDPNPMTDSGADTGTTDSGGQDSATTDANTTNDSGTDSAVADAGTDATMNDDDSGMATGVTPDPVTECGGNMCDLLDPTACDDVEDSAGCLYLPSIDPQNGPVPYAQCDIGEPGTVAEGGDCDSYIDCAPGLHCTAEGSAGKCRRYCCNVEQKSDCPGDQFCVIEFTHESVPPGGPDVPTGVGLCDDCDDCNPIDSAGTCNSSAGCYPIPMGNRGRFGDCTLCLPSASNLAVGESCQSVNDCAPGLGCFRLNNAAPVCVQMCNLEAPADPCPGAATCQDRLGAASRGGTVGICH